MTERLTTHQARALAAALEWYEAFRTPDFGTAGTGAVMDEYLLGPPDNRRTLMQGMTSMLEMACEMLDPDSPAEAFQQVVERARGLLLANPDALTARHYCRVSYPYSPSTPYVCACGAPWPCEEAQ